MYIYIYQKEHVNKWPHFQIGARCFNFQLEVASQASVADIKKVDEEFGTEALGTNAFTSCGKTFRP